jgi:hypothetical protein
MVAAAVSFGGVGSLMRVSLPFHVHVGSLCVRFSRTFGFRMIFGAGLRSGFGEVVGLGVVDVFSLDDCDVCCLRLREDSSVASMMSDDTPVSSRSHGNKPSKTSAP